MHQLAQALLSLKDEMTEVHDLPSNPISVWRWEPIRRPGFYCCNFKPCQKTFRDVASKRRHMAFHHETHQF